MVEMETIPSVHMPVGIKKRALLCNLLDRKGKNHPATRVVINSFIMHLKNNRYVPDR
jgi:hypothetical protein